MAKEEERIIQKVEEARRAAMLAEQEEIKREAELTEQKEAELQRKHELNNQIINALSVPKILRAINEQFLGGRGKISLSKSQVVEDQEIYITEDGDNFSLISRVLAWVTLYWYDGKVPKIISVFAAAGKHVGVAIKEDMPTIKGRSWLGNGYSYKKLNPNRFTPTDYIVVREPPYGLPKAKEGGNRTFVESNIDINQLDIEELSEKLEDAVAEAFVNLHKV